MPACGTIWITEGSGVLFSLTTENKIPNPQSTTRNTSTSGQDEFPTIQKRDNEQIRVEIREYGRSTFVDIRSYYCTEDDPEYKPTKKGITINPDQYAEFLGHLIQIGYNLGIFEEMVKETDSINPDELVNPRALLNEIDRVIRES